MSADNERENAGRAVGPVGEAKGGRSRGDRMHPFHQHCLTMLGREVSVKGSGGDVDTGTLLRISPAAGHAVLKIAGGQLLTIFSPRSIAEVEVRPAGERAGR